MLPSLTDENEDAANNENARSKSPQNSRHSMAFSVESELTITPERYTRSASHERIARPLSDDPAAPNKPSQLAGYVGLFTGSGAVVALVLFLPLPARFGEISGVTQAEAVAYSFYVVGAVAVLVALFVFFGLRGIKGEEGKGWGMLFGRKSRDQDGEEASGPSWTGTPQRPVRIWFTKTL